MDLLADLRNNIHTLTITFTLSNLHVVNEGDEIQHGSGNKTKHLITCSAFYMILYGDNFIFSKHAKRRRICAHILSCRMIYLFIYLLYLSLIIFI